MTPYLIAVLIVVVSIVLGGAISRACGASAVAAPATGLSTVLAIAAIGVRLPGDGVTAAVLLLVAVGTAVWFLLRAPGPGRVDTAAVLAGAGALAFVSLQFLSAGRIGIPGMFLNNDTNLHLLWSEALRSDLMDQLYHPDSAYPLGPHGLMAMFADGTGARMDHVLTGLLLSTPVLMAFTAAAALRPAPLLLRAVAAGFCSVTYLGAAWFAQGAFKEPQLSLFLLAFAMVAAELLRPSAVVRRVSAIPLGLITAGAILTYGHLAVAWLGLAGGIAIVLVLLARSPHTDVLAAVRSAVVPLAVGCVALVVAVAVDLPRIGRFFSETGTAPTPGGGGVGTSDLGNLAGRLPGAEALGVWPTGDFRFPAPSTAFHVADLRHLALVVVIAAAAYLLVRRRDVGLLGAFGAALLIWVVSDKVRSPYVAAKALAILSPFIALVSLRALLPDTLPTRRLLPSGLFVARLLVAGVIVAAGVWSSQRVLRGSPVESAPQRDQLEALRPLVTPGPTLFLGVDDYAGWRLRDMQLGYIGAGSAPPIVVAQNPAKPYSYGHALDWDSVTPATLDRFRYVVTVRSPYASAAPDNFRRLRSTALYEAWERTGPTKPRSTIEAPGTPATRLACNAERSHRRLSRQSGTAAIERQAPLVLGGAEPPLLPGASFSVPVTLPPGPWEIALQYVSLTPLRLQLDARKLFTVPANTGRPGPWWTAGTVQGDGRPRQLVVVSERDSRFTGAAFPAQVTGMVAVRPGARQTVPLRQACGKLVDWYRTARR